MSATRQKRLTLPGKQGVYLVFELRRELLASAIGFQALQGRRIDFGCETKFKGT